jgi:preprotein translocase subunit SecG
VWGSFAIDIPIGMAVLLFGFLFRRPLVALLSPRARSLCLQSIEHFKDQPLHWVLAVIGVLVGTWTHLLWDSFTHDNGWMVKRFVVLSSPITLGDYTGSLCHILQYVSSAAGLAILAVWYLRLPTPAVEPRAVGSLSNVARTVLLLLVCVAAAGIGGYKAALVAISGLSNYRVIYTLLTRSIAWFAFLYLVAGLFVSFTRKPEPVAEV